MRKRQNTGRLKRQVLIFLVILLLGLLNMKAKAQQSNALHWTGAVSSSWNDAGNWAETLIPSELDDVVLSKGLYGVHIDHPASCRNLVIEKSCSINLFGGANLTVTGSLKNSGVINADRGAIAFAGKSEQNIQSDTPIKLYDLIIDNGSKEGVVASCKVSIMNELQLKRGVFETFDTIVILNDNGSAINQISNKSYVTGKLQRKIKEFAEQEYIFPVGLKADKKYFPAEIDAYSLEGINWLTVSFGVLERYNKAYLDARDDEMTYEYIAPQGMWILSPDNEPAGGWFDIKLGISNMTGLADNMFGIVKRPVGAGPEAWTADFGELNVFGGEGRIWSGGYAMRKYCSSFSEYAVGGAGEGIPIELLDFSANIEQGSVILTWSTATETDNDYFVIEKSNGTDFTEVTKMKGGGNSSVQINYSAVDERPFTGVSYYRLKQIDFNGQHKYSKIVSIENAAKSPEMIIFPNPSQHIFNLKFLDAVPKADIVVFNQHGTISYNKTFVNLESNPIIELKLWDKLVPGTYYLQVNTGSGDMTIQQIVID